MNVPVLLNRNELAAELGIKLRVVYSATAKRRLPVAARLASGSPLFAASQLAELRQILTSKQPEPITSK